MNFKLKRKPNTSTRLFAEGIHHVYENSLDNGYDYYISSNSDGDYYFNLLDGEIDDTGEDLDPQHWEVIRIKEEKEMDQFKVGETYLCTKGIGVFTKGFLYSVVDDKSAPEPYIISDSGTEWRKRDLKDIFSQFKKLNDVPNITDQTISVENTKIMIDAEKLRAHIMKLGLDGSQITSYLTGYIQAAKGEM